jgi:hypothetical protein
VPLLQDDSACASARQYLDAVKLRFKPAFLDNGDAMVFPHEITPTAVRHLAGDLSDVLTGRTADRCRTDTGRFGSRSVQAVPFGTITDFASTIKVGRLYSERLVLWDILGLNCVELARAIDAEPVAPVVLPPRATEELASLASNVLSLRELVNDGAAVFLPHPLAWSSEAAYARAKASRGYSGVFFGTPLGTFLATTLAVASDLSLHPYTLQDIQVHIPPPGELAQALSRENQMLQRSYGEIIADARFEYLDTISVAQFHKLMVAHQEVAYELELLVGNLSGKTEQQWRRNLEHGRARLARAIEQQAQKLRSAHALAAAGALFDIAAQFVPLRGTLAAVAAVTGAAGAFIPDEPVIGSPSLVAFFSHAEWVAENTQVVLPGS